MGQQHAENRSSHLTTVEVPAEAKEFFAFMQENAPPEQLPVIYRRLHELFTGVLGQAPSPQIAWKNLHTILTTPLTVIAGKQTDVCFNRSSEGLLSMKVPEGSRSGQGQYRT